MDENPIQQTTVEPKKTNVSKLEIILLIGLLIVLVVSGWLLTQVNELQEDNSTSTSQPEATDQTGDSASTEEGVTETEVTSGLSGYKVTLPDGWGPILKPMDSDSLYYVGDSQPEIDGEKVVVEEVETSGSDNLYLFSIYFDKAGTVAKPLGTSTEFNIGKGEDEIKGLKYTYVYPEDSEVGIGYQVFAGDREYAYVFTVGDKELVVNYSVHGSDPRNLSETVDSIVRSITVNPSTE